MPGSLGDRFFGKIHALAEFPVTADPTNANPQAVEMLNKGASLFWNQSEFGNAGVTLVEQSIELEPRLVRAYFILDFFYSNAKETNKAVRCFERAVQKNPREGSLWMTLGNAYADAVMHDKALVAFQKAIDTGCTNAPIYFNMGNSCAQLGRSTEAIANYTKALAIDDRHFGAWRNLAMSYGRQRDVEGVRRTLQGMLTKNPPEKDRIWADNILQRIPRN